jgi:hypothetical protein
MAGVGRKSDFGKPEFSDSEVENRQDTVDPFLTYEENVQRLMKCGLKKEEAEECVNKVLMVGKDKARRKDILQETSEFRKEIGDMKTCEASDESCVPTRPEDEKKTKSAKERQP